jgi:hypothetical protein
MQWVPTSGDRIKTVITRDSKHEFVYLNGDNVITTSVDDTFLLLTGDWVPWSHQVIDYLSRQRGLNRQAVLKQLLEFELLNTELDFDNLCLKFLAKYESNKSYNFMED